MSATTDKIQGNWHKIKGALKSKYGELTDNDLTYQKGKEEELLGRLEVKLGKSKSELKDFIDSIG